MNNRQKFNNTATIIISVIRWIMADKITMVDSKLDFSKIARPQSDSDPAKTDLSEADTPTAQKRFVTEDSRSGDARALGRYNTPKNKNRHHLVKKIMLIVIIASLCIVGWIIWNNYFKSKKNNLDDLQTVLIDGKEYKAVFEKIKFSQDADNSPKAVEKSKKLSDDLQQKASNNTANYQDYIQLANREQVSGDRAKAISYYNKAIQVADTKMEYYQETITNIKNNIVQLEAMN